MITKHTIESLREFDTALLANTRGYVDDMPPHKWYMGGSIRSLTPDLGPTVGVAVTCKFDSSSPDNSVDLKPYYEQVVRISEMELPVVWVVETVGSRPDHECVTGDGMAKTLYAAGCYGVVTDGYCRDIDGCLTTPFAVHARGTIAHHTPIRVVEIDTPVEVGGITVQPGEIIHADKEGVISIPVERADELVKKAGLMRLLEHEVHAVLRRTDVSPFEKQDYLKQCLKRHGFAKPAQI